MKHPFTGANQAGLILRIVRGKYDPIPSFYSKDLSDIVAKCLTRDTRKRPSIHDLLEMDVIKKKAKTLDLKIPTKDEVMSSIENQRNEMITTFQRKKTEVDDKPNKEIPLKQKSKSDKPSDKGLASKAKDSNLQNYKNDIPRKGSKSGFGKQDNKTEHQIKVEQLENQLEEKKKKHEDFLKKRDGNKATTKDHLPPSYLKEPEIVKNLSEGDKKNKKKDSSGNINVNKSALAVEVPKASNQKVIKPGMKHADSDIVIDKPKKLPQTSQDNRNKTTVKQSEDVSKSGSRQRGSAAGTTLSRQAQLAASKGAELKKKVAEQKTSKNNKKDIEEV